MDYTIKDLTNEEAAYIGEKINEIVPHEVDADEEEFVLKVENDAGEIVGGCIAEAYEYGWSRLYLNTLWVDERWRHHGIGSLIIRELERIARQKGWSTCRQTTAAPASGYPSAMRTTRSASMTASSRTARPTRGNSNALTFGGSSRTGTGASRRA